MYDRMDGSPCTNCESVPQAPGDLFCSPPECRAEYEGEEE